MSPDLSRAMELWERKWGKHSPRSMTFYEVLTFATEFGAECEKTGREAGFRTAHEAWQLATYGKVVTEGEAAVEKAPPYDPEGLNADIRAQLKRGAEEKAPEAK